MPWDGKSLLGYVETIQLIFGVTDKSNNQDKTICLIYIIMNYKVKLVLILMNILIYPAPWTLVSENLSQIQFEHLYATINEQGCSKAEPFQQSEAATAVSSILFLFGDPVSVLFFFFFFVLLASKMN